MDSNIDVDRINKISSIFINLACLLAVMVFIIYVLLLITDKIYSFHTSDWWSASAAIFVAITAISGIFLLATTFYYTLKTRDMAEEMKRQRQILERPAVSVRISPNPKYSSLLNMVIKNTGGGAAYDVSIKFDPDLPYYDTHLNLLRIFQKMPLLDKGESIEFVFASEIEYYNSSNPKSTTATIQYYLSPQYTRTDADPIQIRVIKIDIIEREGQLRPKTNGIPELVGEIGELKQGLLMLLSDMEDMLRGTDND
jgi:hypothetical protein